MLTKNTQMNRDQIEMIALDQLVPANHLVRKIEAAIDFSFIYSLVQDMYSSDRGRPSIDPVVLLRWLSSNIPSVFDHHTQVNKSIYTKRKETIERVFADAKEKHGMRWTTLRGKKNCPCKRCLLLLP